MPEETSQALHQAATIDCAAVILHFSPSKRLSERLASPPDLNREPGT